MAQFHQRALDLGFRRAPVGQSGVHTEAIRAKETLADVVLLQERQAVRPDERDSVVVQRPARHDDGDLRQAEHLLRDDQAVGDQGEVAAGFEVLRHRNRRAAAVEEDSLAVGNEGRACRADALFFGDVLLAALKQRKLLQTVRRGDRAAIRADEQTALGKRLEIGANGHFGDIELRTEIGHRNPSVVCNQIEDSLPPFCEIHARLSFRFLSICFIVKRKGEMSN